MGRRTKFYSVSLPAELAAEIDKLIGTAGYRSRADVVVDAVRRHLEKFRKQEVVVNA
jgi:metal-responsive CopG/Arc/MetJ family transcriptional regulator